MIRCLQKHDAGSVVVRPALAAVSARDRGGLARSIGNLCDELAKLAASSSRTHVWVAIDRCLQLTEETPGFAMSSLNIRLDRLYNDKTEHDFIAVTLTLFNPDTLDLLQGGRPAYQDWLAIAFLGHWKAAVERFPDSNLQAILSSTRVWIYADASRMFGYGPGGDPSPIHEALPEPEEAFVNYWLLLGIEPPAEDQDEAVSPDEIWRICMGTEPPEEPDE
jgi:hypothetical protein